MLKTSIFLFLNLHHCVKKAREDEMKEIWALIRNDISHVCIYLYNYIYISLQFTELTVTDSLRF